MVRVVVIAALVVLQVLCGAPAWLLDGPLASRLFFYSFFHASWLHLVVNCLALWTVFSPACRHKARDLVTGYVIAVCVYPFSALPCIGFSNVLYAVLGTRTPPLSSRWWRSFNVILFLVITLAMCFIPQISGTTHVAAFLLGMCIAAIRREIASLDSDADKLIR